MFTGNKAQRRRYEDAWNDLGWLTLRIETITRASWWFTFRCEP